MTTVLLRALRSLGFFLLINVIMTDGTVEQSLAPAEGAEAVYR